MIAPYVIAIGMDLAAWLAALGGSHAAAGILLLTEAVVLGIYFYMKDRCLVSFRLLLSVFWIGGEGLAAFELSHLQRDWNSMTWLSFSLFYLLFLAGHECAARFYARRKERQAKPPGKTNAAFASRLFGAIVIMTVVPAAAFTFEAVWLGYIPLFARFTHAYDHFHMTGVHYFTVSGVFVPALTVIYLFHEGARRDRRMLFLLVVCNLAAFAVPVLCISKFFFAIALVLPAIIFLLIKRDLPVRYLAAGIGAVAVLFSAAVVVMTLSRHYEEGYLNSIFEMKNEKLPMMFQYVYMYIANNYANFNELSMALAEGSISHTLGLRQLFPVFALTGMKFVFPQLVTFVVPVTKDTLNTLTVIYDAYYDFGLLGVAVFGVLFGAACGWLASAVKRKGNPIVLLLYGQMAMYVILSFFSTWFSVPTTWFWLVLTGLLYLYTSSSGIEKRKKV